MGLDVGLNSFYTDSEGNKEDNPRFLRKAEKAIRKAQRVVSRRHRKSKKGEKVVQSNNYKKALNRLGRKHLKVSRQRKDFAVKLARCVVQSNDLVAIEDLKVKNMVKNRKLSKSISDAAWSLFREWLEYFGKVFSIPVVAVSPHYTTINCSCCGEQILKSLSVRTHICTCGYVADRDENAALNILKKALEQLPKNTVGHTEINACEISECKTSVEETQKSSLSAGTLNSDVRNPHPQKLEFFVQKNE